MFIVTLQKEYFEIHAYYVCKQIYNLIQYNYMYMNQVIIYQRGS